jgi:hypothetical protein
MAKPNYAFAKRQRDLAKKQKKEEKLKRKTGADDAQPGHRLPPNHPSMDRRLPISRSSVSDPVRWRRHLSRPPEVVARAVRLRRSHSGGRDPPAELTA